VKVYFSEKAEIALDKIFSYVVDNFTFEKAQIVRNELVSSIFKLGEFPELGSKLAGQSDKRVLILDGNAILYEIVLSNEPYIIIRNIKPRRTA
jgi:plasmid stabilization system protein ParE